MRRLDIGCGNRKHEGYIGIDFEYKEGVDIVRDLEKGLPFDDDSVDEIFASHILEHLNELNFVMEECYRVLKKGGIMRIIVPHFSTIEAARDPSHVRPITEQTFIYFTQPWATEEANFKTKCNFEIVEQKRNGFELWVKLKK